LWGESRLSLREVAGQTHVTKWLQTAVKQHKLAHAYLFTAVQRTYGKQLALAFAKLINCERHGEDSCDRCPTCIQITHGNHPDVITLQPDGAYIKIDQVRAVQSAFRYRTADGVTRVLIIEDADQMRLETANSLLKFLEEPVSPMVAILLTNKKERILPTIRSRCQWVRLPSIEQSDNSRSAALAKMLNKVPYQEQWNELTDDELFQLVEKVINWSEELLCNADTALLPVQVGWIAEEIEQGRGNSLLSLLIYWLTSLLHPNTQQFAAYQQHRDRIQRKVREQTVFLACDNALIASRLISRSELNAIAIWEQFVLATQAGKLSRENDWRMVVG
jgi:DNA polymerase-3 subunit delta'